jgi:hypothetical protein
MKYTLYNIPVNEALIWDYDWKEEDYKTERFFKWYLARVLSNGTAKELKYIDFKLIQKYIKELNIPRRIARFWFHYLGINEGYKYGNIDRISKKFNKTYR